MTQEYIQRRGAGYYFFGSRVSLDSVAYEFLRGESPEAIVQAFPSLSLEQVYGGITFYLAHRTEMDAYLTKAEAKFETLAPSTPPPHPLLYPQLNAANQAWPHHAP